MSTVPTTEPDLLSAGDTWEWTISLADFPASDGWALTYVFSNAVAKLSVTSSADGDDHAVSVAASVTANYAPGSYTWHCYAENSGVRKKVGYGTMVVEPDLATASATDMRSHALIVLENVRAVLEGRASESQKSYAINGRSLVKHDFAELIMLESRYAARVAAEKNAEKIRKGLKTNNRILVRFGGR